MVDEIVDFDKKPCEAGYIELLVVDTLFDVGVVVLNSDFIDNVDFPRVAFLIAFCEIYRYDQFYLLFWDIQISYTTTEQNSIIHSNRELSIEKCIYILV